MSVRISVMFASAFSRDVLFALVVATLFTPYVIIGRMVVLYLHLFECFSFKFSVSTKGSSVLITWYIVCIFSFTTSFLFRSLVKHSLQILQFYRLCFPTL